MQRQRDLIAKLNPQLKKLSEFKDRARGIARKFGDELKRNSEQVDFFSSRAFRMSQNMREVGFAISDVGRQFVFFGAAVLGSFIPLISQNAQFEQSTRNVIAVLGDLNTEASKLLAFNSLSD